MAKKKFGLSSTLNKNKAEEPTLPQKVPLIRTEKNLEEVKEKVEAIHEPILSIVNESVIDIPVKTQDEQDEQPVSKSVELEPTMIAALVSELLPEPVNQSVVVEVSKVRKTTKTADKKPDRMVRITVDTPRSMHVKLKIKAIEQDITIRDYIINLIKKDLGLK